MNILKSRKREESRPFIPTVSHTLIPGYRKTRNRRYNADGKFIGWSKPKPLVDPQEVAKMKKVIAAAKRLPMPEEAKPFDLADFRPLPGRILLKRPPQITEERGVRLPEKQWRSQPYFVVVKVGEGVESCTAGDRVVFGKTHHPKPVRLGHGLAYHIGKDQYVAGIVEDAAPNKLANGVQQP